MKYKLILAAILLLLPVAASAATLNKPPNNLGLVGYWSFDEGTSTVAHDLSGKSQTGTLSGSTKPAWVTGKYAKGLSFDGSSSYVDLGNTSPLAFVGNGTISAWVKPTSSGASGVIVSLGNDAACCGWGLFISQSSGAANVSAVINGVQYNSPGATLVGGKWYHVVGVRNGATLTIYVNGVAASASAAAGNLRHSGPSTIGDLFSFGGSHNYYPGTIDDVRIYNRALSATEVTTLMGQGEAKVNTTGTALANGTTLGRGLVGYWTFDGADTNWTSATAGKVYDRSGNNNTGTLTSMNRGSTPTIGKMGQGLNFNGNGQYVALGTPSVLDITGTISVCTWVYPTNFAGGGFQYRTVFAKGYDGVNSQYQLNFQNDVNTGGVWKLIWGTVAIPIASVVTINHWYYLCGTFNGSTYVLYINGAVQSSVSGSAPVHTAYTVDIGAHDINGSITRVFAGTIDDVRVYNRSLSAAEVKQLYNMASSTTNTSSQTLQNGTSLTRGLVGYWTFDGKNINWRTNTITDLSGSGNNGTSVAMSTTTSPIVGKLGQALKFDGSSQVINAGTGASSSFNFTSAVTFSAWIRPSSIPTGNGGMIINKWVSAAEDKQLSLINTGKASFYLHNVFGGTSLDSSTVLSINKWYHVVGTYDGSTAVIYINGVQDNSKSASGSIANSGGSLFIGGNTARGSFYFNGVIDDVRIYNRALSAAEVKSLYNLGK